MAVLYRYTTTSDAQHWTFAWDPTQAYFIYGAMHGLFARLSLFLALSTASEHICLTARGNARQHWAYEAAP